MSLMQNIKLLKNLKENNGKINKNIFCCLARLSTSSASYRRDDGDFGAAGDWGCQIFQKAYVLAVDIDVDELAQISAWVTNPSAKARIVFIEFV